jgi:hypothetical protein
MSRRPTWLRLLAAVVSDFLALLGLSSPALTAVVRGG